MLFALNSLISTLANLILGLFVYRKNPQKAENKYFFLMAWAIAMWIATLYLYYSISDPHWVLIIGRLNFAAPTLAVFYLFKFIYEFPKRLVKFPSWVMYLYEGSAWIMAFLAAFTPLIDKNEVVEGASRHMEFGMLYALWAAVFLAYLISGIVVLVRKMRRIEEGSAKTQLKYVFWGMVTAFAIGTTTNLLLPYIWSVFSYQSWAPISAIWLTGWMGYAVMKHKFLDITALVARTVAHTLLIALVVGVEALAVIVVTRLLPVRVDQVVVAVVASVLLILTYDSVRAMITKWTEKIFFKGRYDTEKLLEELTHVMAGTIEIEALTKKLLSRVKEELKLTWAGILLVKEGEIVKATTVNGRGASLYDVRLTKLFEAGEGMYVFEDLTNEARKELFREKNLAVVLPMRIKGQEVGLVLLGPKASGDVVSGQDRQFLSILAPQAAVAVNNARNYQEIQEFSKTLEKRVKERTEELRKAQRKELDRAEELLKLKDEFVFIASHDLATPVTAITGYMDLLEVAKAKLGKEAKGYLEAIGEASERLKDLVDDMLEVARGESGTIRVELEQVELGEQVKQAVRLVEEQAKKKKLEIINNLPKQKLMVQADKEKLAEVLENLLTNAIKYNKEGGVVELSSQVGRGQVELAVRDTGIGIPKEEQGKVFGKFFRSESKEARSVTGTGLGLFVVKMLVTKMGGKIGFESSEGMGTTFRVSLKRAG